MTGTKMTMILITMFSLFGCYDTHSVSQSGAESDEPDAVELDRIKKKTEREFDTISHVTPDQVARWIDANEGKPVVLDVREKVEFDVSHLSDARHVSPDTSANEVAKGALKDIAKDQKIVLYCSVGVRSAIMTKRLKDAGYTNAHNMNGSIFQWANEGRPVYKEGGKVVEVHPYSRKWGKLLKPSRRANVPDVDR